MLSGHQALIADSPGDVEKSTEFQVQPEIILQIGPGLIGLGRAVCPGHDAYFCTTLAVAWTLQVHDAGFRSLNLDGPHRLDLLDSE